MMPALLPFQVSGQIAKLCLESDMHTGHIKWFSPSKGYGFITKSDGTDVYVHYSGLANGQDRKLRPSDEVIFEEETGEKGPKAVNVSRTAEAETETETEAETEAENA